MKKVLLSIIFLMSGIWLQASINIVIAYTSGDVAITNSANLTAEKFKSIYPNATISLNADMQSIIKAFEPPADTLIFYFVGHSNAVQGTKEVNYMGSLIMVLNMQAENKKNIQDYLLVSKSLHYLLKKNMSSKKLVIIDGCYAQLAYNKNINTAWLFASDEYTGTIIRDKYSLFTHLFLNNLQKNSSIIKLQSIVNKQLLQKQYYPEYNPNLVYANEYLHENPKLYPIKTISINNYKF